MKPLRNYLFVESHAAKADSTPSIPSPMEQLAETYSEKGFVYLARRGQEELMDTAKGVRLMPYKNFESLPYLKTPEAVFVDGDGALLTYVRQVYPGAAVFHWDSANALKREKILRMFQEEDRPTIAEPQPDRAIA